MSEAERTLEVESPPEAEAGFCRPFDPSLLEMEAPTSPPRPSPAIANVALAIELSTGLDAVRETVFQGLTYRLKPTPFHTAIRLLVWSQYLERLNASGEPLDDRLSQLRAYYAETISLVGSLVVHETSVAAPAPAPNPFLEAKAPEIRHLVDFALQTGNEVPYIPVRTTEDGDLAEFREEQRYDASFYLWRYLDRFGAIPGAVILENGRPSPASWRHFCAGTAYLRRAEAEQAMAWFGAFGAAQASQERQEAWLAMQGREAGRL